MHNSRFEPSHDLIAAREFIERHKEAIRGQNATDAYKTLYDLNLKTGINIEYRSLEDALGEYFGIIPKVEQAGNGFHITFVRG